MRGCVLAGVALVSIGVALSFWQSAAMAKLPPPELGKRPPELSMLSKWTFQDVKVYNHASFEPPDSTSGFVERYYSFTFFTFGDAKKIAHEFKARLTKARGWTIEFPEVGRYDFKAKHRRSDGSVDLCLESEATTLGWRQTFLFVRDESRPIYKGRFKDDENAIISSVVTKVRPKGW